jgi:glycine cleavage system H protein
MALTWVPFAVDLPGHFLLWFAPVDSRAPNTLPYKRSHFVTQLPVGYAYSPSHCWMARQEDVLWRVGFTKFAVRMLGEMVDHGFELEPGAPVQPGQIVGWIEGFKAISDLYCIAEGTFAGANPLLKERITVVNRDPYGSGWLYAVRGSPDAKCVDVHGYRALLDRTIDRILEKQKREQQGV